MLTGGQCPGQTEGQAGDEQHRRAQQTRDGRETATVLLATEPDPEPERRVDRQRTELTGALASVDDHEAVQAGCSPTSTKADQPRKR